MSSTDMHDLFVTAEGHAQLRVELEAMETEGRRRLTEQLRAARADGDLADNPALNDLLEEHARFEERIATLQAQLRAALVVTPASDGTAGIGSRVRVRDHAGEVFEFELAGAIESDVGNGRVSVEAPVGRALLGRRAGAVVGVETPRGPLELEILSVRPAERHGVVARRATPRGA